MDIDIRLWNDGTKEALITFPKKNSSSAISKKLSAKIMRLLGILQDAPHLLHRQVMRLKVHISDNTEDSLLYIVLGAKPKEAGWDKDQRIGFPESILRLREPVAGR